MTDDYRYGYNYNRGIPIYDGQTVEKNTNRVGTGNKVFDQKILDNMTTAHHERENFAPKQITQTPSDMIEIPNTMVIILALVLLYLVYAVNRLHSDLNNFIMFNNMNAKMAQIQHT